jgi:hypothetical protein
MKRELPPFVLEEHRGLAKTGRLFTHLPPAGEKIVFAFSTLAAVEAFKQAERLGKDWRGEDLRTAKVGEWHQLHASDAADLVALDARSTQDPALWVVPLVAWIEGLDRASRDAGPLFLSVLPYPNRRKPRFKQFRHPMQGRCEPGLCACGRAFQFDFRPDVESDDPTAYLRVITVDQQTQQEVEQCPGCGQSIARRDELQAEADEATAALFSKLPAGH